MYDSFLASDRFGLFQTRFGNSSNLTTTKLGDNRLYLYYSADILKSGGEHLRGRFHVRGPFGECAHLYVGYRSRLVDGDPVLFPFAVFPAHVAATEFGRRTRRLDELLEQLPVEVFAERATDQIERDRVDARVAVAQIEADDAQLVPEYIVLLHGIELL